MKQEREEGGFINSITHNEGIFFSNSQSVKLFGLYWMLEIAFLSERIFFKLTVSIKLFGLYWMLEIAFLSEIFQHVLSLGELH